MVEEADDWEALDGWAHRSASGSTGQAPTYRAGVGRARSGHYASKDKTMQHNEAVLQRFERCALAFGQIWSPSGTPNVREETSLSASQSSTDRTPND